MGKGHHMHNPVVAALLSVFLAFPAFAQNSDRMQDLLAQLADPQQERWQFVERQITREWSHSGSASADLLLQRGRVAIDAGDSETAINHLTALIDHAPNFAEGWNARATAYFQAGKYGQSMADIRETLALNPAHFGALAGMALILEDLGFEDQALVVVTAAIAIHPHRPDLITAMERLQLRVQGQPL
jgi:tetratricopeptide (TPR) repeat protein